MYAETIHSSDVVTLEVADPERSRRFYQDLLGLEMERDARGTRLRSPEAGPSLTTLSLRRRDGEDGQTRVWLSIEVESVSEVLDLYLLATIMGSRAMLPRKRGDRWNTVVVDPDGYRVSIWTRVPRESEPTGAGRTLVSRSPRRDGGNGTRRAPGRPDGAAVRTDEGADRPEEGMDSRYGRFTPSHEERAGRGWIPGAQDRAPANEGA